MLVVISVNRMDSNGVQVCVARPQHNAHSAQTYPSEAAARAVLLDFGMTEKVLDDSLKLLPQLAANQPLTFPPLAMYRNMSCWTEVSSLGKRRSWVSAND